MTKPKIPRAIEYNAWMSLMGEITKRLPDFASEYNLTDTTIEVIPSYPRDLTEFRKPSIIVQKIYSDITTLCMGNYVGQYFDEDDNALYDMHGKMRNMQYQVNVDASGNIELSFITDIVLDMLSSGNIDILDYAHDMENPRMIGTMVTDKSGITYVSSNDNNDYISFIRINYAVIQTTIGEYPTVDLSKPIKFNQKIKL